MTVLNKILATKADGQTLIAQLIDPDFISSFDQLADLARIAKESGVDLFFYGGSLLTVQPKFNIVKALKEVSDIPIVLFPSSPQQIDENADALLFLSLISGRNPSYLIGHHVSAAPFLRKSSLEIIPTGYMLISCGATTTAEYISHSQPIPYNKPEIAASTALAGKLLGMQSIYLDGGSGADKCVSPEMVEMVKEWVEMPVIVGGGIKTVEQAAGLCKAGADVLVIGTCAEERPTFLSELKAYIK